MVPVPCREMWSREGKIDGGFTRRPEFAWGVLNASIGRVHTREAGPRGVSDADRSLLLSRDVHPAYGPRARASKTEDRAGPRPTQTSGLPGGFDRCSGATRREALALPLVPRRGRASGDGVGRGQGPTDGPRGVFRASRAAGRAIMRRLTDWRWRLASYTPDRLHLADESSRQTGAVGGNCELANFYSNRQRPTKPNCLPVSVEDLSTWISQRPAPAAQSEMSHT